MVRRQLFANTLFEESGLDTALLLWGLLFGSVGLGYFIYGKKQGVLIPQACGLALMLFPYFVSNSIVLVLAGLALIITPLIWRR